MAKGASAKPPLWRLGSWIFGAILLVSVPLWGWPLLSGFSWIVWMFLVALVGFCFTAPHGIAFLRGAEAYVPQPTPVRPSVSALTYIAFLFVYRLPVDIGDSFYTVVWLGIARVRGVEDTTSPRHTSMEFRAEAAAARAEAAQFRAEAAEYRAEAAEEAGYIGSTTGNEGSTPSFS